MTFRRDFRGEPPLAPLWLLPIGLPVLLMAAILGIAGSTPPNPAGGVGVGDTDPFRGDLEPVIIRVGADDVGPFRLGDHRFATAGAMGPILARLAMPGGRAYVRFDDDVPFSRLEEAIGECRKAGFAHVALLTDDAGAAPAPAGGDRPGETGDTPDDADAGSRSP